MGYSIIGAVDQIPNNKMVALITMNNPDGNAWLDEQFGTPVALREYGYELVATAQFNLGSEDFTKEIATFKKAGADVLDRRNATAGFHQFLEAIDAAGVHSQDTEWRAGYHDASGRELASARRQSA